MNNLEQLINEKNHITPEILALATVFKSSEGIGRRYLLGRNEHSAELAKTIEVDGFIDDLLPLVLSEITNLF